MFVTSMDVERALLDTFPSEDWVTFKQCDSKHCPAKFLNYAQCLGVRAIRKCYLEKFVEHITKRFYVGRSSMPFAGLGVYVTETGLADLRQCCGDDDRCVLSPLLGHCLTYESFGGSMNYEYFLARSFLIDSIDRLAKIMRLNLPDNVTRVYIVPPLVRSTIVDIATFVNASANEHFPTLQCVSTGGLSLCFGGVHDQHLKSLPAVKNELLWDYAYFASSEMVNGLNVVFHSYLVF